MIQNRSRQPFPLSYQLVAGLVILILVAVLAIGLVGIWSIRLQLDGQAWARVDQAVNTTRVELDNQLGNLNNLALLTTQRPTLRQLVDGDDPNALTTYLETLRQGAALGTIILCSGDALQALVGNALPPEICPGFEDQQDEENGGIIYLDEQTNPPTAWLLARRPVLEAPSLVIVVGRQYNDAALLELSVKNGTDYALLDGERLVASSLPYSQDAWQDRSLEQQSVEFGAQAGVFTLEQTPYYAQRVPLSGPLDLVVALPVTEIVTGQQKLTEVLAAVMVLAILLCGTGGVVLARRISRPLDRLRASAVALRQGNLEQPIRASSRVLEVAQVAYALEDARIALQHSLGQLRQEKAWSNQLLEAVVEGILTLDRQGRITFFSQGAERITGYTKDQVLFKPVDELFVMQAGAERFSQRLPLPGGSQETLAVRLRRPGSGSSTTIRAMTLAITTARLAPSEAGHAQLVLVLRDVTNEEAIRRLLGDFLANITHEFRTPLTAQAVSIELLLDQLDGLSQAELRELLNALHLGVLSLQTLIDNLLEGASIEAGRFRVAPQPTELVEVVGGVARTLQPLVEKYGLELRMEIPSDLPSILADPRRTAQVVTNLLSNAIKWSPRGGVIQLKAWIDNAQVRMSVADQGPGVAPDQKAGLFTWQPDLQTRSERADYGAGLGLSVVRAIVEAQGGRVGVDSEPGQGSVFWFTVPVLVEPVAGSITVRSESA